MKQYWIINAVLAVIAAIIAIMQEVWLGTPLFIPSAFAVGASFGIALSACAEWAKIMPEWIDYNEWSWKNFAIGSVFGVITALTTAIIVC